MYKDTYTQEDVNNILTQINDNIDREIIKAINFNYDSIYHRFAQGINTADDVFCQQCYGKIEALFGVKNYIDDMFDGLLRGCKH